MADYYDDSCVLRLSMLKSGVALVDKSIEKRDASQYVILSMQDKYYFHS